MGVEWKDNIGIADALERVADLLEEQDAMPFRVTAYRKAAGSIGQWPESVAELLASKGEAGLRELPGVGKSIAAAVAELVRTGQFGLLQRLEDESSPEQLLASVPGIGPELARRIHEELGVRSLEELEQAAHDGRLEAVEGFGPRRGQQVRDLLEARLGRNRRGAARKRESLDEGPRPDVGVLLQVDEEYRRKADAGELRTIAPRRFNPSGEAWLPVMRRKLDGWNVRALFSNTAMAHQQKATHDWVVLYFDQEGDEGQCTIVTAHGGPLDGRRVVRGREVECLAYYGVESEEAEAHQPGA
ncbi:DNA-binding protein [Myxococcus llanfairpwllgwyngyllgogerychwyrndrobwllllantysiliogogogochensis]|uniref:DNA-binding protein n=1 Tax=Myxococcus llanfairpwllgwyngyllgogerychwyrndrobwllllantysiliogogogochensis TaxID=2590453 RepID=A0A540WTH5_9BACT|nr:helix-hairpin-helix domain-containing protein [Myxococcus llanfairpwllgwyngyllgogerychwyrndrobwllllantysiliogogogochensis]TQF12313.1 DNA-binding protein [Myxococcus llanfairpwllgwyngyllgogerychwyrndrobwllllantysiliogogogochensis]